MEDISLPHNDALVVRATLASYEASYIFMDVGSLVNVIFKQAFDRMQLNPEEL